MAMAVTATAKPDRAAQVASHQTRLQKIVLSWDYLRLLAQAKVIFPKFLYGQKHSSRLIAAPESLRFCELFLEFCFWFEFFPGESEEAER
jgi:hypothetical protein